VRQFYLGRIYDFFGGIISASYADGLSAMVSLVSTSASRLAGLRSAAILRLRQFIP
jgi:hypothetical protein